MMYSYVCRECGYELLDERWRPVGSLHARHCQVCGGVCQRAITRVTIARGQEWDFQPHFNNSVGRPVSSMHQFREELKKAAARETEATGIYHDYQPRDPRDRDAFGLSSEDVEVNAATNRGVREIQEAEPTATGVGVGEPPPLVGEKT